MKRPSHRQAIFRGAAFRVLLVAVLAAVCFGVAFGLDVAGAVFSGAVAGGGAGLEYIDEATKLR